jgi:hypothetical protein
MSSVVGKFPRLTDGAEIVLGVFGDGFVVGRLYL